MELHFVWPAISLPFPPGTFTAEEHPCPVASTKLYCLVTEARVCVNNLPESLYESGMGLISQLSV